MANDDDIDYTAEGATPPEEKEDPTNAGYDEAAHNGPGAYGVREGSGGVFGTTGGGSFPDGMHIEERPAIEGTERGPDEVTKPASPRGDSSDRGSNRGR